MEETNLSRSLRGATQACIERNTFPHKYKATRRCTDGSNDEEAEKCTICLSPYEVENDVRYVFDWEDFFLCL